jgi:signal transduction histidine kinase/ActR/RegA family two-component response regulator
VHYGATAPDTLHSNSRLRGFALLLLFLTPLSAVAEQAQHDRQSVLKEIIQLRSLSPEEADLHRHVHFRASVTFHEPGGGILYVQDATGGIFVETPNAITQLRAGQHVEITGVTDRGHFLPRVIEATVVPIRGSSLPAPVEASAVELLNGHNACTWVAIDGVVRQQSTTDSWVTYQLDVGDGIVTAMVPRGVMTTGIDSLEDAELHLEGVVRTFFNDRRQAIGAAVYVPEAAFVTVTRKPTPLPFAAPTDSIRSLLQFVASTSPNHRAKISGVVIGHQPPRTFFLWDGSGGIAVAAIDTPAFTIGTKVDVVGFPTMTDRTAMLAAARWQRVGSGEFPRPVIIDPSSRISSISDNMLVTVEGTVVEFARGLHNSMNRVACITHVGSFTVVTSLDPVLFGDPGSTVRITGVCTRSVSLDPPRTEVSIYTRSEADVVILTHPPGTMLNRLKWGLGASVLLLLLGLAWIATLRRSVRQRTSDLARATIAVRESAGRLEHHQFELQRMQSQKMESLGMLASGIAHDVNNLLGIILGHAGLMQENLHNHQQVMRSLDAIQTASVRGATLVRQLLTFARKGEPSFEPTSIAALLGEVVTLTRETFPRTIEIHSDVAPDLPTVNADIAQLHQVFINLCVNARDAMPSGGSLSIVARLAARGDVAIQIPDPAVNSLIHITVVDTGIGMDEDTRRRVFDPFFTTKEPGKGTGLGLALAYSVMQSHGGAVAVESEVGRGTRFHLYFPVRPGSEVSVAPADLQPTKQRAGETILVIEDEEMLADMVSVALRDAGYTVLSATDGIMGVETYRTHSREIDLVVTDFGLARMQGDEVVREIRALDPRARIIVASGFIEPIVRKGLMANGVIEIVQKPYRPKEMVRACWNALHPPTADIT